MELILEQIKQQIKSHKYYCSRTNIACQNAKQSIGRWMVKIALKGLNLRLLSIKEYFKHAKIICKIVQIDQTGKPIPQSRVIILIVYDSTFKDQH